MDLSGKPAVSIRERDAAFNRRMRSVSIINNGSPLDLVSFLDHSSKLFINLFSDDPTKRFFKIFVPLKSQFTKMSGDVQIDKTFYINTNSAILNINEDTLAFFNTHIAHPISTKMSEFEERDSGWALLNIEELTININQFNPLSGSGKIALSDYILNTKSVLNVDNDDNRCFKWSILAGLYHNNDTNVSRVSRYRRYENDLNFNSINFPVATTDFGKFEKQNVNKCVYM